MNVSAFIPCYNQAATLSAAVKSVRQQTLPVQEFFVIDDGSVDGSAGLARQLGLRVIVNSQNLGRGAVRARALIEAQHEVILGCDAAIALPPEFVARASARLQDPRVAAVMGRIVPDDSRHVLDRWRARHLFKTDRAAEVNEHASPATGGVLLRKSLVMQAGNFNAQCRRREDAELGGRLRESGCKVVADPALVLRDLRDNTLRQLLERYWRWNLDEAAPLNARAYLRQISYSLKVMVRDDLRHGDFAAALISLLCPHYLLWRSNRPRPSPR